MAKQPTTRRFLLEDFSGQKSWIPKLIDPLNTFLISVITAFNNQLTIGENMLGQVDRLRVRTATTATATASVPLSTFSTFVDANVNTGTDTITVTAHSFQTGDLIQFSTTGVLPAGLSSGIDYYVNRVDANNIKPCANLANAIAGTAVNITSAAGGGTHTVRKYQLGQPSVALFDTASYSIRFKAFPVFVVLGSVVEVASNAVVIRSATSLDWSFQDGLVTINAVAGLEPGKQYDLVVYTSGG